MPQCAFKSCKNNARKSNLTAGVSYFRFPSNPLTCAEWISIVARARRDDFYKPAKNSVICSDHFDKSDISGNTNRRRLVKTAVPKLQIQPPLQDVQLASPNTKLSVSEIDVQPLSSSSGLDLTQKVTYTQAQAEHISVMTSPVGSLSDLISVCATPRKRFLYKQLLTARKVIDNKSKKIQTLQKVNKRLKKRNSSLKNMVCLLKKKLNLKKKKNYNKMNK
ncbi:uncharacterized protein LOC134201271 isoform X1 [Bombyx mori]|uniref:uncharacterized protein LOC134201271 isoform X1 n=1 Tax=Bombyx mori TaxID=7091 RepID=UPI002ED6250D